MSLFAYDFEFGATVCPRSSYPFYILSYYIRRVTTSWTNSTIDVKKYFERVGFQTIEADKAMFFFK